MSSHLLFDILKRFAATLSDRFDVADVLYGLTDHTVEILDATASGVTLADEDGLLKFVSATVISPANSSSSSRKRNKAPATGRSRPARRWPSVTSANTWNAVYRAKAEQVGLNAVLGIPLTVGEQRLGALNVYYADSRTWTAEDLESAEVLANVAASYILHASRLEQAQRVNEQLQHALTSRIMIEQAKGLLAGEYGVSVDSAFDVLRGHARHNNATLHSVADAVVLLGLRPEPAHAS